jgi:DNA-binding transcriptional MerR regulator
MPQKGVTSRRRRPLLTVRDAASFCNCSERRVRHWYQAGKIKKSSRRTTAIYFDFNQILWVKVLLRLEEAGFSRKNIDGTIERLKLFVQTIEIPVNQCSFLINEEAVFISNGGCIVDKKSRENYIFINVKKLHLEFAKFLEGRRNDF